MVMETKLIEIKKEKETEFRLEFKIGSKSYYGKVNTKLKIIYVSYEIYKGKNRNLHELNSCLHKKAILIEEALKSGLISEIVDKVNDGVVDEYSIEKFFCVSRQSDDYYTSIFVKYKVL